MRRHEEYEYLNRRTRRQRKREFESSQSLRCSVKSFRCQRLPELLRDWLYWHAMNKSQCLKNGFQTRPTWSLATLMLLVAWISVFLAAVYYLSVLAMFLLPVWLGLLGAVIAENRVNGFTRGYWVGALLVLLAVIIVVFDMGLIGYFGGW